MADSKDYRINFFFPKSPFAKDNNKLIFWIVVAWAIASFGFHGLMKAIEKPTPEPAYVAYKNVWDNVTAGTATDAEKQEISKSYLTLIGKYIDLRSNDALKKAFTTTVYELLPEDQKANYADLTKAVVEDKKQDISPLVAALGLGSGKFDKLLENVIPYALIEFHGTKVSDEELAAIPEVMDKYLIHYQSFLTDSKILGFPFHYFYSGVFLLVFYCGLCWYYCIAIDKVNEKHGMEQEEV